MKNFTIVLILIFNHHLGVAQETITDGFKYKVVYELTYQPDSTDIHSSKSEDMYLYIGDKISRFSSAGKALLDGAKNDINGSGNPPVDYMRMRKQIPKTVFNYYLYKGIPQDKITYTGEVLSDKYRYIQDKDLFNWIILNDTDTLAGFMVQKAKTSFAGREYTAWFTEMIPLPEGPYKFNGLPGLILKISDEKGHYIFEMKGVQKLEQPITHTFREEEFIHTTSKELSELQDEFKKDPTGFAKRAFPGFNDDYLTKAQKDKADRKRKERLKKDNNPLELE